MCDVSDGLVADLGHLARASGVGIELDASALGNETSTLEEVTLEDVLTGGEDHALVATLRGPVPEGCRAIGRVVAGSGVRVDGEAVPGGWEHFS